MLEAQKRRHDAIVFVIDQDKWPERIRELDEAQEHRGITQIRRAMGVAIRTFDAWMLADEQAFSKVLGRAIQRQPDPETISDAKSVCDGFLKSAGSLMRLDKMYADIAEQAKIAVVEERCPRGFGVFAGRIREMLR